MTATTLNFDQFVERLMDVFNRLKDGPDQIEQFLKNANNGKAKQAIEALSAMLATVRSVNVIEANLPIFVSVRGSAIRCLGRSGMSAHSLCFHAIDATIYGIEDAFNVDLWDSSQPFAGINGRDLCLVFKDLMSDGYWGSDPMEELYYLRSEMWFELTKAFHWGRTSPEAAALLHYGSQLIPSFGQKPTWTKLDGQLRFRGEICRTVDTNRGKNIVRILDAFEEEKWPDQILCPLPGALKNAKRLKDVVDSLNEGLVNIKFCRTGSAKHISWRPRNG